MCILDYFLREHIIHELHYKGHFGHDKTLALVLSNYYWPKLSSQVSSFIKRCIIYQRSKGELTNSGLCTPLSIPNIPWLDVNMDFILGFSFIQQVMGLIYIIVGIFSNIGHFIRYHKTMNAFCIAHIYFKRWFTCKESLCLLFWIEIQSLYATSERVYGETWHLFNFL